MQPRGKARAAFTLIELLVVISIILLLAAIALPVLGKASRSARTVNCVSNLKQLVASFVAYAQNSEGMLPNTYVFLNRDGSIWWGPTWLQLQNRVLANTPEGGQLYPYFRNSRLVHCPTDSKGNGVFSYSCPVFFSHKMMDQAENPSAALLIIDEHEWYHLGRPASLGGSQEGGFGSIDRPGLRHGLKTPTGYFDGQVRLVEFPADFIAYDVEIPPWGFNDYYNTP